MERLKLGKMITPPRPFCEVCEDVVVNVWWKYEEEATPTDKPSDIWACPNCHAEYEKNDE